MKKVSFLILCGVILAGCQTTSGARDVNGVNLGDVKEWEITVAESRLKVPESPDLGIKKIVARRIGNSRYLEHISFKHGGVNFEQVDKGGYRSPTERSFKKVFATMSMDKKRFPVDTMDVIKKGRLLYAGFSHNQRPCIAFTLGLGKFIDYPDIYDASMKGAYCGAQNEDPNQLVQLISDYVLKIKVER